MPVKSLLFIVILAFTNNLFPQPISWTDQSALHSLPGGVKLFKGTRNSPALNCWYLKVDRRKGSVAVKPYLNPAGKEGIGAFSSRFNTIASINGGFFDLASNASYSALVNPGSVLAKNINSVVRDGKTYILTRSFWGVKETGEMSIDWIYHFGNRVADVYTFNSPTPNVSGTPAPSPSPFNGQPGYEIIAGLGGGPTLIDHDTIKITYNEEVFWGSGVGLTNRDPRTAIGFTKTGEVILFVADGRQTASEGLSLSELADVMKGLGCWEAMNLDGGGSTQMAVGSTLINRPEGGTSQRAIPTMVGVVMADSLQMLPPVYYNKVIDTGDSLCVFTGGGWSASTIAGFWGATPSIICPTGIGDQSVKFGLRLPRSGQYRIDAWWTAASNRAANTPFIVRHSNGTDTVRLNQSLGGLQWNQIGIFTFSGSGLDEVIISNNAQAGQFICADAIRILSFDSTVADADEKRDVSSSNLKVYPNYPNPFMRETTLKYTIDKPARVNISIYDILGKKVEEIERDYTSAGSYSVNIDLDDKGISSGVYFYKILSGSFTQTGKFLFQK